MVSGGELHAALGAALLLGEAAAADKLPPPTRAAAMMALVGIALLGLLLVVIILLGGHWVRRQGSHRRGPSVPPDRSPLVDREPLTPPPPAEPEAGDARPAADTVVTHETNRGESTPRE